MSRIRVLPYKQGSRSAATLAEALGGKVLKLENSRFRPKEGDTIINWGNGDTGRAHVYPAKFIQLPNQQRNASNKLFFFNALKEVDPDLIPCFWTNKEDIPNEEFPIVCRTILNGHSGAGIVISDTREALVEAPLYVKYIKKKHEYRIHVLKDKVISVQRKAKRHDWEDERDTRVRNLSNGYVFVRGDVDPPQQVLDKAIKAIEILGLDFGAVDVIWNQKQVRAYILEVNTAPGLEGQTVEDYAEAFKELIDDT